MRRCGAYGQGTLAVRMVAEIRGDHDSEWAAMGAVASILGCEPQRRCANGSAVRRSTREPGVTSEESDQIKRLKRENFELRRANEILKAALTFFAAELDRPQRYS